MGTGAVFGLGQTSVRSAHLFVLRWCIPASWLRTPVEYFDYEVVHILDTTMAALDADTSLRFHWAETAWLQMWLDVGDAADKVALLKRLIGRGQLEILGGLC